MNIKITFFVLALFGRASLCLGQGHVNFANEPSLFVNDSTTDRFVSCIESGRLTGTNWAAQLWYGIGPGLRIEQLTLSADPIALFPAAGTGTAGTWSGGIRALPGTTSGVNQIVTMDVRIWDITQFPTYLDAAVAGNAPHAASVSFNYTVPAADAPADAFVMYGFRGFGFTCFVPEPSTDAIFALAGVLGWLFNKRGKTKAASPCRAGSFGRLPSQRIAK